VEKAELDQQSAEVKAALTAAGVALDETAEVLDGISKEAKDNHAPLYRAGHAVEAGRALVGTVDPKVTPNDLAQDVQTTSETLRDQVRMAVNDEGGDVGGYTDMLLRHLTQLRQPNAALEKEAKNAAVRFRQSVEPRLRAVTGEIEGVETRMAELLEQTADQTSQVQERLTELKAESDAAKARVDGLISEQDSKFTDAQEERRKEFADLVAASKTDLSKARQEVEASRDEAVERIQATQADLDKTAAALGGRASAMGHGKESDEQATKAFRWSVAAVALLLVAAIVPIAAGILEASQSPESVLGKSIVALVLAGVAGYAATIARHHRERAANARRLELEMASFGPFIATLDPDDQNTLRAAIVWRFYGEPASPQEPDGPPRPGLHALEFIRRRKAKGEVSPPAAPTE
jgi:hypothetical protein